MSRKGLPSRREALRILREIGCPPGVIRHCKDVARLALRIAEACLRAGVDVDLPLVEAGALLHDIGRSRTHEISHALLGAEMARGMGLDERLIHLILVHPGGVTEEQAEALGWPQDGREPRTLEEKIVCYADKLVEKGRFLSFEEALGKMIEDLGPDHPAVRSLMRIREELKAILGDALDACGGA